MDRRRLSTGGVLAAGITGMPLPDTDIPQDRPKVEYDVCDNKPGRDELLAALECGDVLYCLEYYGIPNVWRDGDAYRGCLLQYRAVTETPAFGTAEDALDWFMETSHSVSG
jgi:hypothetical protein